MTFEDQAGARYTGQLEPETTPDGRVLSVLVLTPIRAGQPRRVHRGDACPFLLLFATLDERSRLDKRASRVQSRQG